MARMQHGLARNIESIGSSQHFCFLSLTNLMHRLLSLIIWSLIHILIVVGESASQPRPLFQRNHVVGHSENHIMWCSRVWVRSILLDYVTWIRHFHPIWSMNGFWRTFCKIWLRANVGIHIRKVLIKNLGGSCVFCRRSIDFCPGSRQLDRGWFLTDHRLWMQYSSVTYPSTHIWWGGFILKIVNKHFLGLLFLINVVWQRHCQLSTQFDENTWRSRVWMRSILYPTATRGLNQFAKPGRLVRGNAVSGSIARQVCCIYEYINIVTASATSLLS
jgi:hypothetical protein